MTHPSPPQDNASAQSTPAAIDPELTAIQTLMSALSGLEPEARQRVVDYVFMRLGIKPSSVAPRERDASHRGSERHPPAVDAPAGASPAIRDIRSLAEAKRPRSAVEQAALVAYYLGEIAPTADRKAEIDTEDLVKYFKQAGFPLPGRPRQTLFDAKTAGYLDSGSDRGSYKLNPVGHNLVAHALPSSDIPNQRPAKKAASRRAAKKQGRRR